MIAHVVTGGPVPLAVQWLAAAMLFGGLLTAFVAHPRVLRRIGAGVALLGLAATLAAWITAGGQPGPAPYALRVVAPSPGARAASPVVVTVCGVRADGTRLPATDPQHYIVVFVDGREATTVDTWQIPLDLPTGAHDIRLELVTPSHHAFNPPATTTTAVIIAADAAPIAPQTC